MNPSRAGGEVNAVRDGVRHVSHVGVTVVFAKPGVLETETVSEFDLTTDLVVDLPRGPLTRRLDVVGDRAVESTHRIEDSGARRP